MPAIPPPTTTRRGRPGHPGGAPAARVHHLLAYADEPAQLLRQRHHVHLPTRWAPSLPDHAGSGPVRQVRHRRSSVGSPAVASAGCPAGALRGPDGSAGSGGTGTSRPDVLQVGRNVAEQGAVVRPGPCAAATRGDSGAGRRGPARVAAHRLRPARPGSRTRPAPRAAVEVGDQRGGAGVRPARRAPDRAHVQPVPGQRLLVPGPHLHRRVVAASRSPAGSARAAPGCASTRCLPSRPGPAPARWPGSPGTAGTSARRCSTHRHGPPCLRDHPRRPRTGRCGSPGLRPLRSAGYDPGMAEPWRDRPRRGRLAGGCGSNGDSRPHYVICGNDPLAYYVVRAMFGSELPGGRGPGHPGRAGASPLEGPDVAGQRGVRVVRAGPARRGHLPPAGLAGADGLALLHQDDVGNLHAALCAQAVEPRLRLVLRMFNTSLANGVRQLFNDSAVLSDASMAAPAFVAAALGEVAPTHFRHGGRTLCVARRDDVRPPTWSAALAAPPTRAGSGCCPAERRPPTWCSPRRPASRPAPRSRPAGWSGPGVAGAPRGAAAARSAASPPARSASR